jgi:hypothetical protein
MTNETWEAVGRVGVDSTTLWIGDPAYFADRRGTDPPPFDKRFPNGWDEFCEEIADRPRTITFAHGHEGLGALIPVGDDGVFDVEVRRGADGYIAEVRIILE